MNLSAAQSDRIKSLLQGAAIGFFVTAIGGQFWPGYMLDSNVTSTAEQMTESAVNASASLMCQELYLNAPDSKEKLVVLRGMDAYRIGQDAGIAAASEQALKRFADAKILPAPSSYRVKNDCGEQLHKKPASAAMLR